jgi:hypothetical protein
MPARPLFALLVFAALAGGCSTTRTSSTGEGEPTVTARGDVTVDGVSVLGAWRAVEVVGDAQATRDLQNGTMEQTLLVGSNGRATLTGVDRREGGGPVSFSGRITGSRVTFAGMEGAGTLVMSGHQLVLRDPGGRSTVFVRSGG